MMHATLPEEVVVMRPKCFRSHGPSENVFPARLPWIRHQNELTDRDWENAIQGLGNA